MNFIGKHLNLIGIFLLVSFTAAAAGLYLDAPGRLQQARQVNQANATYVCPMHHKVVSSKPGNCPECGMKLVPAGQAKADSPGCAHHDSGNESGCCSSENASPHAGCSHEAKTQ